MAHDPSLGYADYFAAANAATLMPAMDAGGQELFGLQSGMEMLGMRGLTGMPEAMAAASVHSTRGLPSKAMLVDGDDSTIRFPGEQHQQPSQGPLSLSLCKSEGALHQQLGLFPTSRTGGSSSQQQQAAAWLLDGPHASWHLRSSNFLLPAQQLLQEFCSLPVENPKPTKLKPAPEGGASSSASWNQSPHLQTMDVLELQKLKSKLYTMLEEVDRRYRRYCEQMRALVCAFESVAGERTAAAYTALASRTISRHFRNLRDGIVGQIQAARKALGEKDTAVPGTAKGETPRLKVLDQCLRQQKALHHPGMMESHPWRPQRGLPERAVSVLRAWLFEHFLHPYPSDVDKHILARQTGLSRSQVSNWFINARVRLWKPMVEEMYLEEMKEKESHQSGLNPNPIYSSDAHGRDEDDDDDQKPTHAQLLHDTGSLASVVNISRNRSAGGGARSIENFGLMDHLDFDSYEQCAAASQSFSTGVSLTLGLQQHDAHGGGVNIAFAGPAAAQGGAGFLFPNEQMEGVHPGHDHHQFAAAMEGEASHGQVHYRSLSSSIQLLHDLAG